MKGVKLFQKIREELGLSAWKMGPVLKRAVQSVRILETRTQNPTLEDLLLYHDIAIFKLGWTSSRYIEEIRKELKARKAVEIAKQKDEAEGDSEEK